MAVETQPVQRIFEHGELRLPDPDPDMTPEEVQQMYAFHHPELTNGRFGEPTIENGQEVYTFQRSVGKKG